MKTYKLLIFILLLGIIQSCTDIPVPELPSCQWTYNSQSVSFQPVALMHPSNADQLDGYANIYDMSVPIWCFAEIFGSGYPQKEGSQIKVTTSLTNCQNNTSRTNLYNNSNYVGNIGCASIGNLDRPENGTPRVTLEIKAGPHRNENWEEGYVVWTKTFTTTNGNPYVNQNGTLTGFFIKNPTAGGGTGIISDKIYRDGIMVAW
jgi:hypothetical protein